ncbi:hypothetical protein KR054_001212 [Drosophila jambulina]|nr:hypothetical protein KR054_001212 [Drosophila jambulina]
MIKAYTICRDLINSNAPNDQSMAWLYYSPVYKDVDLMSPKECHKLKRKLGWERHVPELDDLIKALVAILAVAVIFVLLILLVCGVKWRPTTKSDCVKQEPVQQEGPKEIPQIKRKKKLSSKRWLRRSCRLFCVQGEAQARRHELRAKKQSAVHKEHSQRKLAEWTKARERNAQRKKGKLERRIEKESDQKQNSIQ